MSIESDINLNSFRYVTKLSFKASGVVDKLPFISLLITYKFVDRGL